LAVGREEDCSFFFPLFEYLLLLSGRLHKAAKSAMMKSLRLAEGEDVSDKTEKSKVVHSGPHFQPEKQHNWCCS
jgi:hypothetical protein